LSADVSALIVEFCFYHRGHARRPKTDGDFRRWDGYRSQVMEYGQIDAAHTLPSQPFD
jgi:hypothetical protein